MSLDSIADTIFDWMNEISPKLESFDDFTAFKPALHKFFRTSIDTPWWHPKLLWQFYMLVLFFLALAGGSIPNLVLVGFVSLSLYSAGLVAEIAFEWLTTEANNLKKLIMIAAILTGAVFFVAGIVLFLAGVIPTLPVLGKIGSILIFGGTFMAVTLTIVSKVCKSDAPRQFFSGAFDELFDFAAMARSFLSSIFGKKQTVSVPFKKVISPSSKTIKPVCKQSSSDIKSPKATSQSHKSKKRVTPTQKSGGFFMLFGDSKPTAIKQKRDQKEQSEFLLSNCGYLNG